MGSQVGPPPPFPCRRTGQNAGSCQCTDSDGPRIFSEKHPAALPMVGIQLADEEQHCRQYLKSSVSVKEPIKWLYVIEKLYLVSR